MVGNTHEAVYAPLNLEPFPNPEDPARAISSAVGASRRTTTTGRPAIEGGPATKSGRRTGWYIILHEETGEHELIKVKNATQLANLPKGALPKRQFLNLLQIENPELAAELEGLLVSPRRYTAHHTQGADVGDRVKALFQKAKLSHLLYQDGELGKNIVIPPVQHRPVNPAMLTRSDGVAWD